MLIAEEWHTRWSSIESARALQTIHDTHKAEETAPTLDGLFTFHLVPENMSVSKQTETVSQHLLLQHRYVKAP